MIRANPNRLVMYEETDPEVLAQARKQHERFRRNRKWFEARTDEIYSQHRGRHYCVSCDEVFVGDDAKDVYEQAKKAHPEDDGRFTGYIPLERMPRIYAHLRTLV
jgi:hypothetical protein